MGSLYEWISVKDRLPDWADGYQDPEDWQQSDLVLTTNGMVYEISRWSNEGWCLDDPWEPTHWMPLPVLPPAEGDST